MMEKQHDYKTEYIDIFKKNIKREGADKVLEYLGTTDFFDAPASTRFHGNFAGGLVEHCVKVYHRYKSMCEVEWGADFVKKSAESIAVIALLHDICKVNTYKVDYRNVKENDVWVKKPFFAYDDQLPYGHGEKSVYMLSAFMKLTREEAMAINWHMGAFDARAQSHQSTLSRAFHMFPLALVFHVADMLTSYRDEKTLD
ncbi:MAG: HD domain-containing protein [Firmicutes bacterium]|nr:HD domain-containing protein [Bacillota bacterium]